MTIQQSAPSPNNEFTRDEMIFISDHLAACTEYLEHLEVLWLGEKRVEIAVDSAELTTPSIPSNIAEKLQLRVKNNILRGDMGASALKLGTQGFMEVLLALIRPIINDNSKKS